MISQVFYRKWRPQTLAGVVGQEPVTRTLLNGLANGRISHAYLFCGPRGTGKTSTARILAKAVNCLSGGKDEPCNTCSMCQAITEGRALDVIEIDAASNTSVDDVRILREKVNYAPNQARFKVYIIDEVHMLSNSAANALLKTLEEPPPHVIFILATTEVHKILATIMSRCQRFDFRRHSQDNIIGELTRVCQGEGIKMETEAMRLVARSATGSMRDALNLLEQLTTYYGTEIGLRQVQATLGITGDQRVKDLAKCIAESNIPAGIAAINSVNNDGLDLRQFNREFVEYLRALLLVKTNAADALDFTAEDIVEMKTLATKLTFDRVVAATRHFGGLGQRFDNYSTLPLELALIDSIMTGEEKAPQAEANSPASKTVPASSGRNPDKPDVQSKPATATPAPVEKPKTASVTVEVQPNPAANPSPTPQAKPETKNPPSSLTGTPMEASTEIERLKLNWKLIIKQAPPDTQKTPAVAILRSAPVRPVSIDNNVVCLAFTNKIYKEMIEKLDNQRVTEKVISSFLGHPCRIQCILEENHLVKEVLKMGAQITNVEEK
jgi:DNA polymerase-3 subunit gamma/tau